MVFELCRRGKAPVGGGGVVTLLSSLRGGGWYLFPMFLCVLDYWGKLHAPALFCLLVCLNRYSIESPGRRVHSYSVQVEGVSSHHSRKSIVSARGDFSPFYVT